MSRELWVMEWRSGGAEWSVEACEDEDDANGEAAFWDSREGYEARAVRYHSILSLSGLAVPKAHQAIDVIEAWRLNFHLGNAIKYILRAGRKPGEHFADDVEKAIWYLRRELNREWTQQEAEAEEDRVRGGGE